MPVLLSAGLFMVSVVSLGFAATWSPEMQVNEDEANNDWCPQVALDSTGVPRVVWMGVDPVQLDEEIYVSRWDGAGWGSTEMLHPDNSVPDRFPEIASGKRDGIIWVLWARGNVNTGKYDFLVSRLGATGWTEPETVFAAGERYDDYDIVARDTSLVWVVWSSREHGGAQDREILARKRENGIWGQTEQILKPDTDDKAARVDLNSKDELWTVWQGSFQIFSAVRSDTGWSEPLFVKHDEGGSFVPWVVVDDSDIAWIVWVAGNAGGGSDILSARWERDHWLELGQVNSPDAPEDEDNTTVIVNVPGSGPLVVWWGGLPDLAMCKDIYESKWTASGWREERTVSTPDSVSIALDEQPSVAIGPSGRAWVCWMRMTSFPPYDFDVWARYSDDVVPVDGVTDFGASVGDEGVRLSWRSDHYGFFEIWRMETAAGASSGLSLQRLDPALVLADCGTIVGGGAVRLDQDPVAGRGMLSYDDGSVVRGRIYLYWLLETTVSGCWFYGPVEVEVPGSATGRFPEIVGPLPNPFSSTSVIVAGAADVVEVFDLQGRCVKRFSRLPVVRSGDGAMGSAIVWDGRDEEGRRLPSGVYLLRVSHRDKSGSREEMVRKVVILR
jgi:hypothetical protein